jgi:hypothetical protein
MHPTDSAILFTDLPTALARSQQMASTLGCDGVFTKYWYQCIQLTNGQGAMIVQGSGPFGSKPGPTALSQLTPAEIAALQSYTTVQPLLPVVAIISGSSV